MEEIRGGLTLEQLAEIERLGKRVGRCCEHTANDHIWMNRDHVLYSTACCKCECNFWKEKIDAKKGEV
jgi:hypothetical protein